MINNPLPDMPAQPKQPPISSEQFVDMVATQLLQCAKDHTKIALVNAFYEDICLRKDDDSTYAALHSKLEPVLGTIAG
tara:strand:+ start:1127 stop:1360 length:234 start_codon:yes stop_codon:yes gene_type:complete